MSALREILARFDIQVSGGDKVKGADKGIEGLTSKLKSFGTVIAGGLIVSGIKSFIDGLTEQAAQLRHTSEQLGINEQDLQAWQFAAKLSGVEAEGFATSIKLLEKNAAKAAESGATTGGAFQKLGVHLREDAGGPMRDTQEILYDTGIAISKLKDPAQQTQMALQVFGRQGAALLPLFKKGEAGLKDALSQIQKFGGGLSTDAIDQLMKTKEATEKWEMSLTSVKSQLVVTFLPAFTNFVTKLAGFAVAFSKNQNAMAALRIGVVAVGAAFAVAGLAAAAPWIPVVALFVGLALLLQDIMVGLQGGDSLTGRFLDKVFGKGTAKSVFADLKQAVTDYNAAINSGHSATEAFWQALTDGQDVMEGIKLIFHDMGTWVDNALSLAAAAIRERFGQIPGDIADVVNGALQGSLHDIIKDFEKLGEDIVQGIIDGVENAAGKAEDALKNLGKRLIGGAKQGADSHSPSVPMIKLGRDIGLGAEIGAMQALPGIGRTFSKLGQAAVNAPAQAIQNTNVGPRSSSMQASIQNTFQVQGGNVSTVQQGVRAANDESLRAAFNTFQSYF